MRLLVSIALAACCSLPAIAIADSGAPPGPTVTITAADAVDAGAELDAAAAAVTPAPTGIATSPGADKATGVNTSNVADPTRDPGKVVQQLETEKDHGGWFAAMILGAYFLCAVIMRMSGHVGWFATDRHLAILVGATGVLGACVDKLAEGASWQTVAGAAAVAIATFVIPVHPNAADGSATTDGTPTGLQPKLPGAVVTRRAS